MRDINAIGMAARDLLDHDVCLLMMHADDTEAGLIAATEDDRRHAPDHPARAKGHLLRRRMVRSILERLDPELAHSTTFGKTSAGQPLLSGAGESFHLSFSARGDVGLVGLARFRIGVDLEAAIKPDAIPYNVLRQDEQAELKRLPERERVDAFLSLWTMKEAAVKAIGLGLYIPPERIFKDSGRQVLIKAADNLVVLSRGTILTSTPIRGFRDQAYSYDQSLGERWAACAIRID